MDPRGCSGIVEGPHELPSQFNDLALRLFEVQYTLNTPYRALCNARGVLPDNLSDWTQIPAVPTSAFKEFAFTCLPDYERTVVFESSGTTQSLRSRCYHSPESLRLYEDALLPWFQRHLLPETVNDADEGNGRWDFISLTPSVNQAPRSSLARMLEAVCRQPWFDQCTFIGQVGPGGQWNLDFEALAAAIQQACARNQPVVLTGTAFNWVHLLETPGARQLRLPQGSRLMETGGYKGQSRELPRTRLHAELSDTLGIPPECIVTEYGMTELSSQGYDQVAGSKSAARTMKLPPWTRVTVVSPETGLEVAPGESGLVRLLDLANAFSVMAVETEDLAIRHSDGIELLGRQPQAQPRGCSLMTA